VRNSDTQSVAQTLSAWSTLGKVPHGSSIRQVIERFLNATTPETRRAVLARESSLLRLQDLYRELAILRPDPGERSRELAALLVMANEDILAAIRGNGKAEALLLLQSCFEFGKGAHHAKHEAARLCLLELWALHAGGPNMKYALYPNGILFSGGGKTHEEMARKFISEGHGGGPPQAGGLMTRTGPLAFAYDLSSTAFRANGVQPSHIGAAFKRWLRNTGADETKVSFNYAPESGGR
jgi:hypothetical protein